MKLKRKLSALQWWIISFLVMLLMPQLFNVTLYQYTLETIQEEVLEKNELSAQQLAIVLDNEISVTQRLYVQLISEESVAAYAAGDYTSNAAQVADSYQVLQSISTYQMVSNSQMYLYFKESNKIITDTAVYDTVLFYETYAGTLIQCSYQEWYQSLQEVHIQEYNYAYYNGSYQLTLMQSIPMTNREKSDAVLVIQYNQDVFDALIREMEVENGGCFAIMDKENQFLMTTQNWPDALDIEGESFLDESVQVYGDYVILAVESDVSTWNYLVVSPTAEYMRSVDFIQSSLWLAVLSSLAAGLLAGIYFFNKNYTPIRNLVRQFDIEGEDRPARTRNEFDFLSQEIEKSLALRNESQLQMQQQREVVQAQFLHAVFDGQVNAAVAQLENYGGFLENNRYVVIHVQIDLPEKQTEQEKQSCAQTYAQYKANSIVDVALNEMWQMHAMKENWSFSILAFALQQQAEESVLVKQIQHHFTKLFVGCDASCGVSACHNSLKEIADAYQQAKAACEYKVLYGKACVVFYQSVAGAIFEYSFEESEKQEILRLLFVSKSEQAKQLLQKNYMSNLLGQRVSPYVFECLRSDLTSLFYQVLEKLSTEQETLLNEMVKRITLAQTADELWCCVEWCVDQLVTAIEAERGSRNYRMRDEISAYVQQNYADYSLSAGSIAAQFKIHPSYLSVFFKEQTGEKISEYIARTRVIAAKTLLLQGERSLDEIALAVGLNDGHALIRVFKKYEQMTPGQYRQKEEST